MTRPSQRVTDCVARTPLAPTRVAGLMVCASVAIAAALPTGVLVDRIHRQLRAQPQDGIGADARDPGRRTRQARADAAREALPGLRARLRALQTDDGPVVHTEVMTAVPNWLAFIELAVQFSDATVSTLEQVHEAHEAQEAPGATGQGPDEHADLAGAGPAFRLVGSGTFDALRRLTTLLVGAAPHLAIVALSIGADGERRTFDATLHAHGPAPPLGTLDDAVRLAEERQLAAAVDPFAGAEPADMIVGTVEVGGRRRRITADGRLIETRDWK